jgi:hypothetical protein
MCRAIGREQVLRYSHEHGDPVRSMSAGSPGWLTKARQANYVYCPALLLMLLLLLLVLMLLMLLLLLLLMLVMLL